MWLKWCINCCDRDNRSFANAANENGKAEKDVASKNDAPFRSCISKINSTLIDNAGDLGIVMPIYNLLEYNQNYSMKSGNLWDYYRGGWWRW